MNTTIVDVKDVKFHNEKIRTILPPFHSVVNLTEFLLPDDEVVLDYKYYNTKEGAIWMWGDRENKQDLVMQYDIINGILIITKPSVEGAIRGM